MFDIHKNRGLQEAYKSILCSWRDWEQINFCDNLLKFSSETFAFSNFT